MFWYICVFLFVYLYICVFVYLCSRIMKRALPDNAKMSKESKQCVQECVSEFIAFITSEASERLRTDKRKTITGDDGKECVMYSTLVCYIIHLYLYLYLYIKQPCMLMVLYFFLCIYSYRVDATFRLFNLRHVPAGFSD